MSAKKSEEGSHGLLNKSEPGSLDDIVTTPAQETWLGAQQHVTYKAWRWRALLVAVFAALLVLFGALLSRRSSSSRLPIKFMVIGDFGRRGDFNQSAVARMLAIKAADMDPDFIISVGDNMYPSGLTSPDDAAFDASFVQPYNAKSLQVPWYVILGNHDYGDKCYDEPPGCYVYGGDAFYSPLHQLDANLVARDWRWNCKRTFEMSIGGGLADLFFIDTNPFVQKYYEQPWANFTGVWNSAGFTSLIGGLTSQEPGAQLDRLQEKLRASRAPWKIVIGHHPPRSNGHHGDTEELVELLEPVFQETGVQAYFAGHDHNLEHIHAGNDTLHYVISGGGSKSDRPFISDTDSLFQWPYSGFVTAELSQEDLIVRFYGFGSGEDDAEPIYKASISR